MAKRQPLLLVRHAQAEHHVRGITGGWTDTSLTPDGLRQSALLAERLGRELSGVKLTLGASNLQRAAQTAEMLGQALGCRPQIHAQLTDLNNGAAANKTHAEARRLAIPASEPLVDWQPYPQAESWRQFHQRISGFMDGFSAVQTTPALLVTHAAVIDVIVGWWLRLGLERRVHFDAAPASLTVLVISRWGEPSVERLNDTAHLYAGGIAGSGLGNWIARG